MTDGNDGRRKSKNFLRTRSILIGLLSISLLILSANISLLFYNVSQMKNAYAMGPGPGGCSAYDPNHIEYDSTITSFTISNGSQTINLLANPNSTLSVNANQGSYTVTYTIHVLNTGTLFNSSYSSLYQPSTFIGSSKNGSVWQDTNENRLYPDSTCYTGMMIGQDKTISMVFPYPGFTPFNTFPNTQHIYFETTKSSVNYSILWVNSTTSAAPKTMAGTVTSGSDSAAGQNIAGSNVVNTATSTQTLTTTSSLSPIPLVSIGSTLVQQGTIASTLNGKMNGNNSTILAPKTDAVYTGTISYTASKPVILYVLHAYPIGTNQMINSTFGQPLTVSINGQLYAVTALSESMSSNSQSGSTVFSGNGLLLVSNSGPFLAAYSLKATADAPTIVNDFSSAIPTAP